MNTLQFLTLVFLSSCLITFGVYPQWAALQWACEAVARGLGVM